MTDLGGLSKHEAMPEPAATGRPTSRPQREAKPKPITDELPLRAEDALLQIYSEVLDELEKTRIANANRLTALDRDYGIKGAPPYDRLAGLVEAMKQLEDEAAAVLAKNLEAHPLWPWIKSQKGVGAKQGARLLAAIGDPSARRSPGQLWAYCGFHVVDGERPRRARGQRSNWNGEAKKRAWLIASKCVEFDGRPDKNGRARARSPYRDVYDGRRARTASTHPEWSDGHAHNDALSFVAKRILRDLWREARRVRAS